MAKRVTVKIIKLISPLFLFFLLFVPYSIINKEYIVEWFGCGCPKLDELGNMLPNQFNANDFTAYFWLFVSICATVIAFFLSKSLGKRWKRALYVLGIFVIALLIAYQFHRSMMWN